MSNPFCQDGRDETPAPSDPTEAACMAIACLLHEWLQEDIIDAQEFISAVGHLPVSLAVLFPPHLFDAEPFDAEPFDAELFDAEPFDAELFDAELFDAEPLESDDPPFDRP